jgi:L-ascorbate metabolism protein UlaG (beta-lactamase superfamily)
VDLNAEPLDWRMIDVLPVEVAEECRVVPLWVEGPRDSVLVVATTAPARPTALDEVARVTGKARVVPLLATDAAVSRAINRLYYPHLLGARRPVEAIPLPEADEHLPLMTDRSEYLMPGPPPPGRAPAPSERGHLPVMSPLTEELPDHEQLTDPGMRRVDVTPRPVREPEPEVWVYGWGVKATRALVELMEDSGLQVRVARTEDVVRASAGAVVVAPVQSVDGSGEGPGRTDLPVRSPVRGSTAPRGARSCSCRTHGSAAGSLSPVVPPASERMMFNARLLTSVAVVLALSLSSCKSPEEEGTPPPPPQPPMSGDAFPTSRGDLIVHPVNHATFLMNWAGKTLYVDPVGGATPFQELPAPDVILVTDIHGDHLNKDTLTAIVRPETVIVAPQAVRDLLPPALQGATQVLANGGTLSVADIPVEAIPMYNLTSDRLQYHVKGRGNGYVLTFGDKRVYIAGDTEDIPEMRALRNIDVAFVPMNLPFTMTVAQAAEAVREFRPKVVYPYHSRGSDLDEFTRRVGTDLGIEVRVRNWY